MSSEADEEDALLSLLVSLLLLLLLLFWGLLFPAPERDPLRLVETIAAVFLACFVFSFRFVSSLTSPTNTTLKNTKYKKSKQIYYPLFR